MSLQSTSWKKVLEEELGKSYFLQLQNFVESERRTSQIFPPEEVVYNALNATTFEDVKVVIVGQDPYHGDGQANGLAFSVAEGVKIPPSLVNIYKELKSDLGITPPKHGSLEAWAKQGVLLLNATLTVRKAQPASHQRKGWELFTDAIIHAVAKRVEPCVFILWGKSAQDKCRFLFNNVPRGTLDIVDGNRLILLAPHPSPLSSYQGFFGSRPFSKTNQFLREHNKPEINW